MQGQGGVAQACYSFHVGPSVAIEAATSADANAARIGVTETTPPMMA